VASKPETGLLFRPRPITAPGRTHALAVEDEQQGDGRWIVEVPELPGEMAYGQDCQEAIDRVRALTLRVLADRLPQLVNVIAVTP
jgi:predicted RNase H-like HicB family nuclease